MLELVTFIVTELVDKKDEVKVEINGENITISVAKDDIGKIIGRQGRTAKAIRTIVKAASVTGGVKYNVDIQEE